MNKQAQLSEQVENFFIHLTQSIFSAVVRKSLEKVRSNGDLFQSLRISSEQKNHPRYCIRQQISLKL